MEGKATWKVSKLNFKKQKGFRQGSVEGSSLWEGFLPSRVGKLSNVSSGVGGFPAPDEDRRGGY